MSTSPAAPLNRPELLLVATSDQSPSPLLDALADDFVVSIVGSATQALARLSEAPAELIVAINPLADMSGEEFCGWLHELPAGQLGACVMLVDEASPGSIIHMFQSGADDCLPISMNLEELVTRLTALVCCCRRQRELNPLTGLPGNAYLEREITRRLPHRGHLAVIGFDLEDFKAYNDAYGYYRGDEVISLVARILKDEISQQGQAKDCVAHIGGDDFFVLTTPDRMHNLAQAAITEFERAIPELYDEEDRRRGGIISFTRQGQEVFFPIMRLIATAATNEAADIQHVGQLAAILSQLKEYARRTGKRELVVDRRKIHDARRAWPQWPADRG